ncbi:hypothetical protein L839_3837 [Mycobacterium avium MAV_120809_2495]|nr:hypothetical protein L839_3837 [Mycobacterium avium MAV_120809_2495]
MATLTRRAALAMLGALGGSPELVAQLQAHISSMYAHLD